jgi:hypothetical protein
MRLFAKLPTIRRVYHFSPLCKLPRQEPVCISQKGLSRGQVKWLHRNVPKWSL